MYFLSGKSISPPPLPAPGLPPARCPQVVPSGYLCPSGSSPGSGQLHSSLHKHLCCLSLCFSLSRFLSLSFCLRLHLCLCFPPYQPPLSSSLSPSVPSCFPPVIPQLILPLCRPLQGEAGSTHIPTSEPSGLSLGMWYPTWHTFLPTLAPLLTWLGSPILCSPGGEATICSSKPWCPGALVPAPHPFFLCTSRIGPWAKLALLGVILVFHQESWEARLRQVGCGFWAGQRLVLLLGTRPSCPPCSTNRAPSLCQT